ncbi:hypothetical protein B0H10DRAFT_2032907 [Mycena sp. CBHHK59/15]|nr:hypothetical protein B0H10DRAFT_2032907 [Mycena sp. CBHHK59/15]
MQASEPAPSRLQVAGVVSFYIVAALVMVFVNKAVLNKAPDLPFTFLFIQFAIAVLLYRLLALVSRTPISRFVPLKFEVPMFQVSLLMNILPYLSVGLVGLIFNTLCLANVDASFFQIARGLLLPFTIFASSIHTRVRPKPKVFLAAFIVTCGFLVGTSPSLYIDSTSNGISRESARALFYGCISSFVLAIHAVLNKSAVAQAGRSVLTLSYWGNLNVAVMMVPCLVLHGELDVLRQRIGSAGEDWTTFAVGSGVTGSLSIKVTSAVTHMFSSAARSVIQTILGVLIFGDRITTNRLYSIAIITSGTIYFTWVQSTAKNAPSFLKSDNPPPVKQ